VDGVRLQLRIHTQKIKLQFVYGSELLQAREKAGLSQRQLGKLLGLENPQPMVDFYENQERVYNEDVVVKLKSLSCSGLRLRPDEL